MAKKETPEIIQRLIEWDDAYTNGQELVSDAVYDVTRLQAFSMFPQDTYFQKVGSDVRGGKIPLPYTMGGLDQIYEGQVDDYAEEKLLKNGDDNEQTAIVSDKLDGVSIMIVYRNGKLEIAYSRGNGTEGADITRHLKKMPNVPKTVSNYDYLVVRGENIMKNPVFDKHYKGEYKTARARVSGAMNGSDTEQSVLNNINFVAYEIVDTNEGQIASKKKQLELLKKDFEVVNYAIFDVKDINDHNLIEHLDKVRKKTDYELDGLVVTTEDVHAHDARKGSSLNPTHSIKFKKLPEGSYLETNVVDVHYNVGKSGSHKPRIEIEPVELFGTTVTYVTGHNASKIVEFGIGKGARIVVTKSGQVIPYLVRSVKKVKPLLPEGEGVDWEWNETKKEAVVTNIDAHPDVRFERLLSWCVSMDVPGLKEASLKSVLFHVQHKNETFTSLLDAMVRLDKKQWETVIGANGAKIYDGLHKKLESMDKALFLGALPYLGFGFGVRKGKKLVGQLGDKDLWSLKASDIAVMDGFDKTANAIIQGLPKAAALWKGWVADGLIKEAAKAEVGSKLSSINAVFTGVRDKVLQGLVESEGGKVGSSVSKNTTHLVAKDVTGSSDKLKKARDAGVQVVSLEDFRTFVMDTLNEKVQPKKKGGLSP